MILGRRSADCGGGGGGGRVGGENGGFAADADSNLESIVDLRNLNRFRENFYLVRVLTIYLQSPISYIHEK